ncbi:MAG: hypothetical protein M1814_000575 [Vezdaea aestivalis]|nr:MAG: hypothetical protein M1814_000575 [Vezdaea aestivalis]
MLVTKEPGGLIISERVKILKTAGQMSFDQLSSLRHRGAFTTVSATFETSCWLCKQLNTPETLSLLGTWYEQTFIYMREKSLVVTRRSAGLPNLLIGILSADPQGEAVETSILALLKDSVIPPQKFDKLNIDLPQVHAMNCLRAILNTSRLSTVKFASRVLKVAANSLSSNVWAIRNCGSMLFRTVVDQLFGTNIAQECNDPLFLRPAVRISYDSHPELLLVLEEILDNNSTAKFTNQEAVILALEVLYRSGSSAADQRDLRRKVRPYQGDRVWHVRVLAARTLCVLCDEAELVKEFVTAMNSQTLSQNRLHGELLCARELISRFFGLSSPMEHQDQQILQAISCGTQTFLLRNTCPFTQSLFVDIINFVYSKTCVCECENNSSICQCLGATLTSDQFGILKEAACSQSKTNGAAPLRRSLGILHCLTAWKRRSRASIRESILWLDDAADEGLIDAILHSLLNGTLLEQARESSWDAQYWAEVLLCLLEPNSLSVTAQEEGWTYMPLILEKPGVLPELLKSQSFPQRLAGFERQFNDRMLSPSKQNANLITLGYAIRLGILQGQGRSKHLESRIQQWILLISNAAKDSNNLDTRISGIRSLRAGLVGLDKKICDLRSGLFISVYFALYNYLNDDDKSIREVASDVVSQVLGGTDIVKTPIAAAEELLESLSATFAKESEFFHQVTAQLFRQDIVSSDPKERCSMVEADLFSNLFLRPIETSVSDRQTAETVLFAEEKQNLYLDPILETTRWTQVLLNISVDQKSPKVTEAIRTWTEQGLKFLIKTAAKEEDGALGWTSKPEVFEIGYRLIKTAQVVLRWLKDVNEKNSISQLLREFITISEENLVHGLWIKAAREVVASIV